MRLLLPVLALCAIAAADPIPVVLWHGMGDSCCNPLSMGYISKLLRTTLGSNLYVHSLMLGENVITDTEHGYFSNMNDLVEEACNKVQSDPKLVNGYNAVGFSQGALFTRALVQRCPTPRVFNLVSIGGPQQGIYGLPFCPGSTRLCDAVRHLLHYGAYSHTVQRISVQAQYWHDPYTSEGYRQKSIFLADLNCEQKDAPCNATYKEQMLKLENMLLVKFLRDEMVLPKESEWFGYYPENNANATVELEQTPLYREDWIGLRTLKESGRLHLLAVDGMHLQMSSQLFVEEVINKYLNGSMPEVNGRRSGKGGVQSEAPGALGTITEYADNSDDW